MFTQFNFEEPFNRGFELKWVKEAKGCSQFPSLLVELGGGWVRGGCSTDMSDFRIITRLVIGKGTKDSTKYLFPFPPESCRSGAPQGRDRLGEGIGVGD